MQSLRRKLLGPQGVSALTALTRRPFLLAFDFDGTLAPIVTRPADARPSPAVLRRLQALAERVPVAIVTGRSVADARARLGFVPRYLVGSHGAEGGGPPDAIERLREALEPVRRRLERTRETLTQAGVTIEDKGVSIALHYRLARDRDRARRLLDDCVLPESRGLRIFPGKMVVNLTAANAPDKADAVSALLRDCGAEGALFAGDDVNDEPVFERAPPHWVTVRVGRDAVETRARFFLDGPEEMPLLLERVLSLLD